MEYLAAYIVLGAMILWFAITMIVKLRTYRNLDDQTELDKK